MKIDAVTPPTLAMLCALALASCSSAPYRPSPARPSYLIFDRNVRNLRSKFSGINDSRFSWVKSNYDAKTGHCYLESHFIPDDGVTNDYRLMDAQSEEILAFYWLDKKDEPGSGSIGKFAPFLWTKHVPTSTSG